METSINIQELHGPEKLFYNRQDIDQKMTHNIQMAHWQEKQTAELMINVNRFQFDRKMYHTKHPAKSNQVKREWRLI